MHITRNVQVCTHTMVLKLMKIIQSSGVSADFNKVIRDGAREQQITFLTIGSSRVEHNGGSRAISRAASRKRCPSHFEWQFHNLMPAKRASGYLRNLRKQKDGIRGVIEGKFGSGEFVSKTPPCSLSLTATVALSIHLPLLLLFFECNPSTTEAI
jgi:hypothetical protein